MEYHMNDELDSCPFCGKQAVLEQSDDYRKKYHVVCVYCGAKTADMVFESEAISAWNARVYK